MVTAQLTMMRLVITLFIIAMLGMIAPGLPTIAQPVQVPHENPTTATGSLDKVALLRSYSQIINLATDQQYQDAQEVLTELKHADIPDELRYIIDRYNNLDQSLFTTLDNLESLLDEASTLLSHNQIHEAQQKLDYAKVDIQDARFLLEDIEVATETMSQQLGVFASPIASQIRQAHARLEASLERLRELIDELNKLRESLTERYVQMIGLITPELSLSIMPESVFVGDSTTASGRVRGGGKPLSGRKLTLTLDNKPIATTTIEADGSYAAAVAIPYIYVNTMSLMATYEPSGADANIYLASESPPVTINTRFYPTLLEASAPEIVHPGLPFTLSGRVSSTNGNIDRTVKIYLDDTQLTEEKVSGQFDFKITPPEQVATGRHSLTVSIHPQGRYSDAAETRIISISKLPVYIDAQTPKLVLLPRVIQISGKVYHELGPVSNARVNLHFKDSSGTARTSLDGSFTTSLEAPLDLSLASSREFTITTEPLEPWYTTLVIKRQIFTINPLNTGLLLVVLIALVILVHIKSKNRARAEKGIPQAEVIELPAITPPPGPKHKPSGIKVRIISAYRGGLETVEKISGIGMAPNITLREFLKMAALLSPTANSQFTELTVIAESTLYSARSPREDTATRAEILATNIQEELSRGTS